MDIEKQSPVIVGVVAVDDTVEVTKGAVVVVVSVATAAV